MYNALLIFKVYWGFKKLKLSVHSGLASKSQISIPHIIRNGSKSPVNLLVSLKLEVHLYLHGYDLKYYLGLEKKLSFSCSSLKEQIGENVLCGEKGNCSSSLVKTEFF